MNDGFDLKAVDKIVFLLASPLTKRDEDRFGLRTLEKNGFKVEVWDLSRIVNPRMYEKSSLVNVYFFESYRVLSSEKEFSSLVETLSSCKCLIFSMITYSLESYAVFRVISKNRLPYALLAYNFMSYAVSKRKSFWKKVVNITPEKLRHFLFLLIPYWYLGIKPASMMLVLGGSFDLSKWPIGKKTRIIHSHYFDYDVYLEQRQEPVCSVNHIGVFLDNYLPFHPDWVSQAVITPEEYYPLVRRFFDYTEQKTGAHITIAAHPRSNYDQLPDYFGGRAIIKDKTVQLVREAQFVILHDSWSVNFAVLYKKPLLFITTDKMKEASAIGTHYIDFMASLFGKKPINLNDACDIDWERELYVDEERYRDFKRTYIKDDRTDDTPIWELFSKHLKSSSMINDYEPERKIVKNGKEI